MGIIVFSLVGYGFIGVFFLVGKGKFYLKEKEIFSWLVLKKWNFFVFFYLKGKVNI